MSIIGWIIVGLLAGWMANKIWRSGAGLVITLLGVVGGFPFNLVGGAGRPGLQLVELHRGDCRRTPICVSVASCHCFWPTGLEKRGQRG